METHNNHACLLPLNTTGLLQSLNQFIVNAFQHVGISHALDDEELAEIHNEDEMTKVTLMIWMTWRKYAIRVDHAQCTLVTIF